MPVRKMIASVAALTIAAAAVAAYAGQGEPNASPIYGVTLPLEYRNWQVVSVAHEAGSLNDIRIILGNDIAIEAYRDHVIPFPDGSIIARLAYEYVPSAQNNAIFGREQSFVAGDPTNVQIDAKDSKRFPATAGWGYAQFENGKVNPSEALTNTCFACHNRLPGSADLVFTHYAP